MTELKFNADKFEAPIIAEIARRAAAMALRIGEQIEIQHFMMDITAVHCNGTPLRLRALADTDDFNFSHDVFGIYRHLNRETGELMDCFLPRFAKPETPNPAE